MKMYEIISGATSIIMAGPIQEITVGHGLTDWAYLYGTIMKTKVSKLFLCHMTYYHFQVISTVIVEDRVLQFWTILH